MEKCSASVGLLVEECKAGLRRFIRRIAALVLMVGLCWPAAVRAEVVLEASEIDSSAVNVERVPVVAPSPKSKASDSTQVDSSHASRGLQEVSAGSMDDIGTGKRIADKLISGATVGFVVGSRGPYWKVLSGAAIRAIRPELRLRSELRLA